MIKQFLSRDTELLRASEIRDLLKLTEGRDVISFAGGLPDPSTFPVEDIKKIAEEVIEKHSSSVLQYSATAGILEFRRELVNLSRLRGIININENNIIVTVGSQEALYMIFNILVDPGDVVIVEKPTYLAALNVLRTRRPIFYGVDLEDDGLNINQLENILKRIKNEGKRVKLLYTIPTAQNPAGVTMSLEKRRRLLELASEYNFLIVEDDAYGFLTFQSDNLPAIKALDRENRVIYTGTFSKIFSPGLRLGWVVADEEIISELELFKQNIELHTPTLSQAIALEALRRGVIQANLPRIRRVYMEKRDVMLQAIEENFTSIAKWTKPLGGMFVFMWVNEKIDTTSMLDKALQRGVAYVPGASFYFDGSGRNTMRLNYSFPTKEQIIRGIRILSQVVREEMK
ncbi:MAG: PLP-dependent aminotransferase family protein [Sulfolobaceae archaeon]